MALSQKTRKRLSILVLVVGLPVYILVAVKLVSLIPRQNIVLEFAIYVVLGVAWIFPLKGLFLGVDTPDPTVDPDSYPKNPEPEKEKAE